MRTSEPGRSELASVVALIGKQGGQPSTYWSQCDNPSCRRLTPRFAYTADLSVCQHCGRHGAVGARERIRHVADADSFVEHDAELAPLDPLGFVADAEPYRDKLRQVQHRTGEPEGAVGGSATIGEHPVEIVVLDFAFMGGTLSCVVGEKVARAAERARERASALITINTSGGARMHEGLLALMQLGKTITSLSCLAAAGVPHISVLANPTLGGVTASYAGIGDVLIAESGALVGFAGPRVIEQITRQPLPSDAQRAAFLLEHGMADLVLERKALRPTLIALLRLYAARHEPQGRASRPPIRPACAGREPESAQTRGPRSNWLANAGARRHSSTPSWRLTPSSNCTATGCSGMTPRSWAAWLRWMDAPSCSSVISAGGRPAKRGSATSAWRDRRGTARRCDSCATRSGSDCRW